jgi:hypothetical protein
MDSIYAFPKDPPDKPIIGQIKDSVFISGQQASVVLDRSVRGSEDLWVELHAQFGTGTSGIEININRYSNIPEVLEFIKGLHRLTGDLVDFVEAHHLKTEVCD